MIVVAVVALLTGGGVGAWRLNRLSTYYRQRAIDAANNEARSNRDVAVERYFIRRTEEIIAAYDNALLYRLFGKRIDFEHKIIQMHKEEIKSLAASRDSYLARANYNAELKRKYDRAAHYPWLPVEPDPPEPE